MQFDMPDEITDMMNLIKSVRLRIELEINLGLTLLTTYCKVENKVFTRLICFKYLTIYYCILYLHICEESDLESELQ